MILSRIIYRSDDFSKITIAICVCILTTSVNVLNILKNTVMALQVGFYLKSLGENSFSCQKLGQLVVKINPGEGAEEILPSALLSLSGDDGYRKNAATSPRDAYAFTDLFPGSFYLRPLLKVFLSILDE
jgi:hypothetical protein